jgi:hypothetical protein
MAERLAATIAAPAFAGDCLLSDEVGWDHVRRLREEYPPLTVRRLVLDAVHPVEDNLPLVHDHVGGGTDAEPDAVCAVTGGEPDVADASSGNWLPQGSGRTSVADVTIEQRS